MLFISKQGHVDAERVKLAIHPAIERGPMHKVNGIVVHQTNGPTAQSTFHSYQHKDANGAHFLIDKDGTIYQTASLSTRTDHVGRLKSRCLSTHECAPAELKAVTTMQYKYKKLSNREYRKKFPERYPSNMDSIGIELVGVAHERDAAGGKKKEKVYETVTIEQNASLQWLVRELIETFGVEADEVYRHPDLSRKNLTEATTAKW